MKKTLLLVFLSITLVANSKDTGDWLKLYEPHIYNDMPYRLMRPADYDSHKSYPLIVSLHRGGCQGTDNLKQMKPGLRLLSEEQRRKGYPCYVIAPQSQGEWSPTHLQNIKEIIKELPSVDMNRIYVLGHSMGGAGTYKFIQTDIDYFAAAAPSAGSGLPKHNGLIDPSKITDIPIWAFHGDQDKVCPYDKQQKIFTKLQELGGNMKLTTWVGDGHPVEPKMFTGGDNGKTECSSNRCDQEPDFLKWLFAQKRTKEHRKGNLDSTHKPNIILVFIDDMGYSDFSCFGNDIANTPEIDGLADEGIAFEQFYVNSPICSPSRVAISTGHYPQRWKITSFLGYRDKNEERGMVQYLDTKAPMLARSLKEAGYATGHFGKWHMGGQRDDDTCPHIIEYGFDESLTNFEGLGKRLLNFCYSPGKKEPFLCDHNSRNLGKPEEIIWMDRSKVTGGFADAALTFIKKAEAKGKPFYVNVWPDDVHGPLYPPLDKWKEDSRGRYMAVLENMDAQLGDLFNHIKNTPALRDNTMILVCSDNGPARGQGRSFGMRGQKAVLYEAGVRSPLVVWAPGLIEKKLMGTRNDESIFSAIDIVPSLIEIAGAKAPKNANFDGEELSNVLLGQNKESRKAPIFFRRPPDRKQYKGDTNLPDLAMRYKQWKFYCDYDGSRPELYNLSKDLGETTNLTDKQSTLVKKLTAELVAWHKSLPQDNGADFK